MSKQFRNQEDINRALRLRIRDLEKQVYQKEALIFRLKKQIMGLRQEVARDEAQREDPIDRLQEMLEETQRL